MKLFLALPLILFAAAVSAATPAGAKDRPASKFNAELWEKTRKDIARQCMDDLHTSKSSVLSGTTTKRERGDEFCVPR